MRVHLIKKETVEEFSNLHIQSRSSFDEWLFKIKYADWESTSDILNTFPSADFLGNGTYRVVFDVGGNNYRLIGKYAFGEAQVHLFICWIGTHAEYDKLCKKRQQYLVNKY